MHVIILPLVTLACVVLRHCLVAMGYQRNSTCTSVNSVQPPHACQNCCHCWQLGLFAKCMQKKEAYPDSMLESKK